MVFLFSIYTIQLFSTLTISYNKDSNPTAHKKLKKKSIFFRLVLLSYKLLIHYDNFMLSLRC